MSGNEEGRERTARRIHVTGRVQGVCFRAWMIGQASELGLDGWVRNRHDGSVEAVAAGASDRIEELVARCRRGPSAARVDDVRLEETPGIVAAGFIRKPTV